MIDERQEELAALYSADLLDGTAKAAFEAEIAHRRELGVLVAELREANTALALTTRQFAPPPALKARILAAIEAPSRAAAAAAAQPDNVVPFSLARLAPWGLAAGLALTAGFLGLRLVSLRAENAALRTERELAEVAYKMAQTQLGERTVLAEKVIADLGARLKHTEDLSRLKITALASLLGNTPEAKAIAVWDPEQQSGLLTVEKLPAIAAEQDYQIWVIDPQYPIPVDGGVFKPDSTGHAVLTFKADKPVKQAAAFAISLEKKGGVPKAEGPLVLLGKQ